MSNLIILEKHEEEHLLHALESALNVRAFRQIFLWTQVQLQGLLPHEIMVCIQFKENNQVERIECLRSNVYPTELIDYLCDRTNGLAVRLSNHCRTNNQLPCVIEGTGTSHPLALFQAEILHRKLGKTIVHGTSGIRGGDTFFALFDIAESPTDRYMFFLKLLLPSLHLIFQRIIDTPQTPVQASAPLLSTRELEVLQWVAMGKSNYEISIILELSLLTIKNHMQRIFRKLNVNNRVQAVLHCTSLHLLPQSKNEKSPTGGMLMALAYPIIFSAISCVPSLLSNMPA